MDKPRPRIGVDMLYYAKVVADTVNGCTYETPVRIQGVSEVSYNPNSQVGTYFADDGAYETYAQPGEIDAGVKVADLTPEIYADLTGASYSSSTGLVKDGNIDSPPDVALGFRAQKSNGEYRYVWLLKGKFSKSAEGQQTKGSSINFQEREIAFKGASRTYDSKFRKTVDSDDDNIPAGVTNSDLANTTTGWFSTPNYEPASTATPISDLAAASGSGSGEIDLTFSAPTGATNVIAQVADPTLLDWVEATTSAAITAASTSATIEGLTPSNSYKCRLVVTGGSKAGVSNSPAAATAHA